MYEAIRRFATIDVPPDPNKLRTEAAELAEQFPLSSLFSTTIIDHEGRTVAREPGAYATGHPARSAIVRNESMRIMITVSGQIEHGREIILNKLNISRDVLTALCEISPFVPKGCVAIFSRGFWAFFTRDYTVSTALLVPYLEASLRQIMKFAGVPTTAIDSEGIESGLGLSVIFGRNREALVQVLPEHYIFMLENIFENKSGETVRHRLCHGLLTDNSFYADTIVYGLWLMFSLTVLPLLKRWDETVERLKLVDSK